MKPITKILPVMILAGTFLVPGLRAGQQQKWAQTGFQFLSVVSDAQAAATAEAMTARNVGSRSLFFNPAGMTGMTGFIDFSASQNQWIADIIHNTFSLALRPAKGKFGVLGFSVQSVGYGDFYGTRVNTASDLAYDDTGIFQLDDALAAGCGYAKSLSDQFSVGGQVRWTRQDLGESVLPLYIEGTDSLGEATVDTSERTVTSELTPLAFDFGTQYKTGIKSLVIGMSVRNFSKEIKYVDEGFQLPLVFNLGITMNVLDFLPSLPENQSLILSVDASHYRSHPEQVKVGLDYNLLKALSLRGGYISGDDYVAFSFGIGVSLVGCSIDYAYTPHELLGMIQRMTVHCTL